MGQLLAGTGKVDSMRKSVEVDTRIAQLEAAWLVAGADLGIRVEGRGELTDPRGGVP